MQQVTSSSCDICFKECSHHLQEYSKWPGAITPHRFHQLLMVGVEKLLICSKSFANNDTRICTPSFCGISGWNSKTQVIMLANTLCTTIITPRLDCKWWMMRDLLGSLKQLCALPSNVWKMEGFRDFCNPLELQISTSGLLQQQTQSLLHMSSWLKPQVIQNELGFNCSLLQTAATLLAWISTPKNQRESRKTPEGCTHHHWRNNAYQWQSRKARPLQTCRSSFWTHTSRAPSSSLSV
jgi:hypothetical protein